MRMRMRHRAAVALTLATLLVVPACRVNMGKPNASESPAQGKSIISTKHATWKGEKFKPTAIVLHWTDGSGGNGDAYIENLKAYFEKTPSMFDASQNSNDPHPTNGHVGSQLVVTLDGKAYQLTKSLDTLAHHATCANPWAVGVEIAGSDGKSGPYIGDNDRQFRGVVALVQELMAKYNIPAVNEVGPKAWSGRGIVSHKQVDAKCTWKDGERYGNGKSDVDDKYLKRVLAAVR